MDPRATLDRPLASDAAEFVRFCYARRRVCWPALYDEMCLVATRRLFRGWGHSELAEHGVGFSLYEIPALAGLVQFVIARGDRTRESRPRGRPPRAGGGRPDRRAGRAPDARRSARGGVGGPGWRAAGTPGDVPAIPVRRPDNLPR